jgi:hypothetical protein
MRIRRGFKGRAQTGMLGDALTPSKFGWYSKWRAPFGLTIRDWQSAKKTARHEQVKP